MDMAAGSFADSDGMEGRRLYRALALAYFAAFAVVLLIVGSVVVFGRASDGDPVVRIDLVPRASSGERAATIRATQLKPASAPRRAAASSANVPVAASQAIQPTSPAAPEETAKLIVAGRNLVSDPALIEETDQGPLPRVGADGRLPMNAYAPPVPPLKGARIAIVVGGLGISAKETASAIRDLPAGVTLAFAPYEADVSHWVTLARQAGHEVLLEVPMEPYDFPDSDPGPHTLRVAAGEQSNTDSLIWTLTRSTGYAGITNLLGSRFLSDPVSLEPVMAFVARRGLLFFDNGSQVRSVASDIARRIKAPYVQSTVTLDTVQTGTEIDARLSELEQLARANGVAAGTGFVYPITIVRIADWAKGLKGRGLVLVPASAIVTASK